MCLRLEKGECSHDPAPPLDKSFEVRVERRGGRARDNDGVDRFNGYLTKRLNPDTMAGGQTDS